MRHGAGASGHTDPEQPSGGGDAELRLKGNSRVRLSNLGDNPCRSTSALETNSQLIDVLATDLSPGVDRVNPSPPLSVSHAGIESGDVHPVNDSESLPETQRTSSELRVTLPFSGRYHRAMDENERLREKFKALVEQLGGRKQGIAEICRRFSEADDSISPKYLDQIYAGFQGKADQTPRTPGRELIKRLEKNLGLAPRWFYLDETYPDTVVTPRWAAEPTTSLKTADEVADTLKKSIEAMLEVWGVSPKDLFSARSEAQRRVIEKISHKLRQTTENSGHGAAIEIRATEVNLDSAANPKKGFK